MKVSAEHGSTRQEARETIDREMPLLLQRFGGRVSNVSRAWRGDTLEFSFRAVGSSFEGSLQVTDRCVTVEVGIPLMFRMFQGRIEDEARTWCGQVFGRHSQPDKGKA